MRILYVSVERRYKLFNGRFFVQGIENVIFFERYLQCFDAVKVIARVEIVNSLPENHELFEHKAISIEPIFTVGTGLTSITRIYKLITSINKKDKVFIILRTPGVLAYLLSLLCIARNIKFSIEVVTNPIQEAEHLSKNPIIRLLFRLVFLAVFKLQLRFTQYASFVTEHEIQNKFLSGNKKLNVRFNSSYSSVVLQDDNFADEKIINARINRNKKNKNIRLLFIGVLDRDFKGLDVFLNLISVLPEKYTATIIGDGLLLGKYKKIAEKLNVLTRVDFCGYISSSIKKQQLMENADFFILTSRREGLPRVVIEAMAYGLPCVCTSVSGVNELIDKKLIFPIDDYQAAKNILLGLDDESYADISIRNFRKSKKYGHFLLAEQRKLFYLKVISGESSSFK
ncbi:glycosyltransferase [Escherichia coli]